MKENAKYIIERDSFKMLPEPVCRYFNHVFNEKQLVISEVQISHSGFFKASQNGKWVKIKGKQYFRAGTPEFIWTGKTFMFKACDKFTDGKGSLTVKLFSILPIVNESGPHVDQAEMLRWLGESTWFPTNLLPSGNLKWEAIDSSRAKLSFSYNSIDIYYIVTFNDIGEIESLQTERYMEEGRLEKWVGRLYDYRKFDGIRIPTRVEASWCLEESDFRYVDFCIDTVEYSY